MSSIKASARGSESPLSVLSRTPSPLHSPAKSISSDTIRVEIPISLTRSWAQVVGSPTPPATKVTAISSRKVFSKSASSRRGSSSSSTTVPDDSPDRASLSLAPISSSPTSHILSQLGAGEMVPGLQANQIPTAAISLETAPLASPAAITVINEESKPKRSRITAKKAQVAEESVVPKKPVGRPRKRSSLSDETSDSSITTQPISEGNRKRKMVDNLEIDMNELVIKIEGKSEVSSPALLSNSQPQQQQQPPKKKIRTSNGSSTEETEDDSVKTELSEADIKPSGKRKRTSWDNLHIDMNESVTKVEGKRKAKPPTKSIDTPQPPPRKKRNSNGSTSTEKEEEEVVLFPALVKTKVAPNAAEPLRKSKRKHEDLDTEENKLTSNSSEKPVGASVNPQPPTKKTCFSDSSSDSAKNDSKVLSNESTKEISAVSPAVQPGKNKRKRKHGDLDTEKNEEATEPHKRPIVGHSANSQEPKEKKVRISNSSTSSELNHSRVIRPSIDKAKQDGSTKPVVRPGKGKRKIDPLHNDLKKSVLEPSKKPTPPKDTTNGATRQSMRNQRLSPKALENAIANGDVAPKAHGIQSNGTWTEPEHDGEKRKTIRKKKQRPNNGTGKANKDSRPSRVKSAREWKEYFAAQAARLPEPQNYHRPEDENQDLGIDMNLSGGKSDEQEAEEMKDFYANEMSREHKHKGHSYFYRSQDSHHTEAPESFARTRIPEPAWMKRKYEAELEGELSHHNAPFKKFWVEPAVEEANVRGKINVHGESSSQEESSAREEVTSKVRDEGKCTSTRSAAEVEAARALMELRYGAVTAEEEAANILMGMRYGGQ